ncbi:hypothetical protein KCP74_06155 [Salmonella enterica subsp. enterica]|nr:hypothetical protein KCP74_06155 [Salmonella enterica subsp. enterica]
MVNRDDDNRCVMMRLVPGGGDGFPVKKRCFGACRCCALLPTDKQVAANRTVNSTLTSWTPAGG